MAFLSITAEKETAYTIDHLSPHTEIRTDPDNVNQEQYVTSVRLVFHWDVYNIASINIAGGVTTVPTIPNLYFNGAGPTTASPPAGFGQWQLLGQTMDRMEAQGTKFYRVTEEWETKDIDGSGNPNWQTYYWT